MRRIKCVLAGDFQYNKFHPHRKCTTNVAIKATYKNDIVGVRQSHDHFKIEEEDRVIR